MTNAIHALEHKYYTSKPGWQNGTLEYHEFLTGYIPSPEARVREIGRVLRLGGHFVFRTLNIYHFASIISQFTPHSFHLAIAYERIVISISLLAGLRSNILSALVKS